MERFTGDVLELSDGLDFVAVAMGLFGLGEIFYALDHRVRQKFTAVRLANKWPSRKDLRDSRGAITRGSFLGFVLGILPGGSGTLSSMASYALERRVSKTPERFGKGAIEGVASPEAAKRGRDIVVHPVANAGNSHQPRHGVILGGLMLQGIAPGPRLITENPVVMLGTYTISNTVFDMWIVIGFGVLGYLMKKTGFDPGPLLLAFVLGSVLEESLRRSLRMFDGDFDGFVTRPISGTLVAIMGIAIIAPFVLRKLRRAGEK